METTITRKRLSKADKFRFVSLTLAGKNLDPNKITAAVGIQPDTSGLAGMPIPYQNGKKAKVGHWTIRAHRSKSRLETQLKEIAERIEPVKRHLIRVLKDKDVERAYLDIAVEPPTGIAIANYSFDAELLNKFTSLGINIDLSIWIPGAFDDIADEVEREEAKGKQENK